jgi:Tfp pilus assembly protein PilF
LPAVPTPGPGSFGRLDRALAVFLAHRRGAEPGSADELLARHPDLRELLEPLLGEPVACADAPASRRLGDFELLRELGRGGMGVVYEARQVSMDRRVALKVLPHHVTASPTALARFKREAATAGKLVHEGIVAIHSVGAEGDVHWFAMELVRGQPLDRWVRERASRQPDARERLLELVELVARVADALAHAHAHGVVHRDVKPGNILVRDDGRAVLTDFGLAHVDDLPSLTNSGDFAGTPHYVSPEQAAGGTVDARSDVFSLGATLYELLAGRRPFEGATPQSVLLAILRDDPPDPHRHAGVPQDLAAVVLKALEKDPARRYAGAAAFADDLRRFANWQPVLAQLPTRLDRLRRFVRRSPAAAAALALALLLAIGLPAALWWHERRARAAIEVEAEVARSTVAFLISLFESSRPGDALGEDMPVSRFLALGTQRIGHELKEQPEVRSRLLVALAHVHFHIGAHRQAETLLAGLGDDPRSWPVQAQLLRANLRHAQGDFAGALALHEEALAACERTFGARSVAYAERLADHGATLQRAGRANDAEAALRRAVQLHRELAPAGGSAALAEGLDALGSFLVAAHRPADARPLLAEALALRERLFPRGSPATVSNLQKLGRCLTDLREFPAAGHALERALGLGRRIYRDGHPQVAAVLVSRAYLCDRQGRLADGEAALREALAIEEAAFGADHADVAWCLNDLGSVLVRRGRAAEGKELLGRALAILRRAHGERHASVATALANLADAETELGNIAEAETLARRAVDLQRQLDAVTPALGRHLLSLAWVLTQRGLPADAERTCREALALLAAHDAARLDVAKAHNLLALLCNQRNDGAGGEAQARRGRALLEDACPPGHPLRAQNAYMLGWALERQGEPEAETFLREAIGHYEQAYPDGHVHAAYALDNLGGVLVRARRLAEAKPLFERALALRRRFLAPGDHWLLVSIHNLGALLFLLDDDDASGPLLDEAIRERRKHGRFPDRDLAASLGYGFKRLVRTRDWARAAELGEECHRHQAALHPAGAAAPAQTASLLGSVRLELGELAAAETLLRGAWQSQLAALGREHADTQATARRLAALYERRGEPDRAAEFRSR